MSTTTPMLDLAELEAIADKESWSEKDLLCLERQLPALIAQAKEAEGLRAELLKMRTDDLCSAAAERDALKAERDDMRFKLGVYASASEISGMSWSGFNIIGDKKSISEVQRLENRSSQLDDYQQGFANRLDALKAELAGAKAQIAALTAALTPSAETKCEYSAEVKITHQSIDEEGGEVCVTSYLAWTTIKEVMSLIRAHAGRLLQPTTAHTAQCGYCAGAGTDKAGQRCGGCDGTGVPAIARRARDPGGRGDVI